MFRIISGSFVLTILWQAAKSVYRLIRNRAERKRRAARTGAARRP